MSMHFHKVQNNQNIIFIQLKYSLNTVSTERMFAVFVLLFLLCCGSYFPLNIESNRVCFLYFSMKILLRKKISQP